MNMSHKDIAALLTIVLTLGGGAAFFINRQDRFVEKLGVAIEGLRTSIDNSNKELRAGITALDQRVHGLDKHITVLDQRVHGLDTEVHGLRRDIEGKGWSSRGGSNGSSAAPQSTEPQSTPLQ